MTTASYRQAKDLLENIQAMVFEWDSPEESLTEFGKGAAYLARKVMALFAAAALAEGEPPEPSMIEVVFVGGPWDGQRYSTERVTAPVFAVGHEIGNHYWLDTKSGDPPAYHWDGTEWEIGAAALTEEGE